MSELTAASSFAPRPSSRATDTSTMVARSVRLSFRNVDALLVSLVLPVIIMVLFVYLFGGAIQTGMLRYVDYVVPGVVLLCTAYVSAMTATGVTTDLQEGVIDRFRSLDVPGTAVLTGHVVGSLARNVASTVTVLLVALLIGFRPSAGPVECLAAAGVLLLFALAVSWMAAAFGLLARTPEGAGGFVFLAMFLPYPSSAFVPVETMPAWLRGFAEHQPATPVIETLRGLLVGTPTGDGPALAGAWCAGLILVSMLLAAVLYRRRTA